MILHRLRWKTGNQSLVSKMLMASAQIIFMQWAGEVRSGSERRDLTQAKLPRIEVEIASAALDAQGAPRVCADGMSSTCRYSIGGSQT